MGDETKVQMREVAKGVEAVSGIVERYLIRFLGPLGRKISQASKAGRYMALAGVVTILVSLSMIFFFDKSIRYDNKPAFKKRPGTLVVVYQKKGYGIPLFAGIGLLIAGIMQKQHRR